MAAVRSFQLDASLAPYDLASFPRWRALSCHVSAAVLDAHQPVGGNINVLAEADPARLRPATAAEEALYAQLARGHEAEAAAAAATAAAAAGERADAEGKAPAAGQQQQQQQQPGAGAAPVAAAAQQAEQGGEHRRWTSAPHAGRCFYTPLPRLVKRGGLSPQELTGGKGPRLGEGSRVAPLYCRASQSGQCLCCRHLAEPRLCAHWLPRHAGPTSPLPPCPPAALNLDKSRLLEELLAKHYRGDEDAFLGACVRPTVVPRVCVWWGR